MHFSNMIESNTINTCQPEFSNDRPAFKNKEHAHTTGNTTSGRGLHEMGKGSVRAAIASEMYLSDVEVKLHNIHLQDQVFITTNDEHVEEISMKQ